MTIDNLILGVAEGDESVLKYLEGLSPNQVEELFCPMFPTIRPERKPESVSHKTKQSFSSKPKTQDKLSKLTPDQLIFLKQQGLL